MYYVRVRGAKLPNIVKVWLHWDYFHTPTPLAQFLYEVSKNQTLEERREQITCYDPPPVDTCWSNAVPNLVTFFYDGS
jgi:hypothetical protein